MTNTNATAALETSIPMGVAPGEPRLNLTVHVLGRATTVSLTGDQIFTLLNGGSVRDVPARVSGSDLVVLD